jgi:hypothetical protein
MFDSTDEQVPDVQPETIVARYRAELEQLNYILETINTYLRSIRRVFRLMDEHGVETSAGPCR